MHPAYQEHSTKSTIASLNAEKTARLSADANGLDVDAKYDEEFEEMRCIGRGNFGAAFLVKFRNSPEGQENYFIAKKIILGQLSEKEQEGSHLEVSRNNYVTEK